MPADDRWSQQFEGGMIASSRRRRKVNATGGYPQRVRGAALAPPAHGRDRGNPVLPLLHLEHVLPRRYVDVDVASRGRAELAAVERERLAVDRRFGGRDHH